MTGPVEGTGKRRNMPANPEVAKLLRKAIKAGATVQRTRGDHYKVCYRGQWVVVGGSPSDHRAGQNARASLRRMLGLEV